jgi:hypothetical protein
MADQRANFLASGDVPDLTPISNLFLDLRRV